MFHGILSSLAAALLFSPYLVLPGFFAGGLVNIAGFWRRSLAEKLLWSVALSFPLGTIVAVLAGHWMGPDAAQPFFFLIGAASLSLGAVRHRQGKLNPSGDSVLGFWPFALIFAGIAVFCLIATAPILLHGHLLEGVFTNDWYIRLPLQHIAATGPTVPSVNPFYAISGRSPELRYYYFFYVLCAVPMRLFGLEARAALTASVMWGAVNFFAVGWLLLRYLVIPGAGQLSFAAGPAATTRQRTPPHSTLRWRRQSLLFVLISLVAGLDLIPNLLALALGGRLYPTLFWWNLESISAWPGVLPFAPHHVFGLASAMMGYLLLSAFAVSPEGVPSRSARQAAFVLAGVCFAAALGTSTFLAATTMAASAILGLDALLNRRWRPALGVACSLALTLLLDARFIARTVLHQGAVAVTNQSGTYHFPLKLVLRFWHSAYALTWSARFPVFPFAQTHGLRDDLLSLPMLAALYTVDLGFFAFIVWYQARQDLLRRHHLPQQMRSLWILFLTCTALGVWVSSAPMQENLLNDFGRHNAFLMRFVLALWACPIVTNAWQQWRSGGRLRWPTRVAFCMALSFAAMGLAGDAWDVTVQRIYLPLVDNGRIRPRDPFVFPPGFAVRYAALRDADNFIDLHTPADALVQYNPTGLLQRPVRLYLNRRVAAGDIGCESAFGGDPALCRQVIIRPLLSLYAQPTQGWMDLQVGHDTTSGHFVAVCAALRLTALIVTDYDPVWQVRESWVWTEPALYSNDSVRVIACPAH